MSTTPAMHYNRIVIFGLQQERATVAALVSLLILVTAAAFHPLLLGGFEFVNYDDAQIVYLNPEFLREGGPRLSWMFAVTPEQMRNCSR